MSPLRRVALAAATGVLAGAGGVLITLILHSVQHLLFGYDTGTFLLGIEAAAPWRRIGGAAVGGLVVGVGWAWLRRNGRPTTVSAAIADGARLPVVLTGADALLQAVAVGGGASVGREGAPRQVGGAAGAYLADRLDVDPADRSVLVAAGAGGGLAAVYNVPVAGVVFSVLALVAAGATRPPARASSGLVGRLRARMPRLAPGDWVSIVVANGLATATAWTVLGLDRTYSYPDRAVGIPSIPVFVGWAILAGPLAAAAALGLDAVARRAMSRQPVGWVRLPLATTAAMGLVGLCAVWWPALPGNGKGVVELSLDPVAGARDGVLLSGVDLSGFAAAGGFALLVLLKIALTGACLRAGIVGGLLTPALAVGAALGSAAALAAGTLGVAVSVSQWAMVAAAAVVSVSHRSVLFGVLLAWELTGLPWTVALACVLAGTVARFCVRAAGRDR